MRDQNQRRILDMSRPWAPVTEGLRSDAGIRRGLELELERMLELGIRLGLAFRVAIELRLVIGLSHGP